MCVHGCRWRTAATTLTYNNYLHIGVRLIIITPDGNNEYNHVCIFNISSSMTSPRRANLKFRKWQKLLMLFRNLRYFAFFEMYKNLSLHTSFITFSPVNSNWISNSRNVFNTRGNIISLIVAKWVKKLRNFEFQIELKMGKVCLFLLSLNSKIKNNANFFF